MSLGTFVLVAAWRVVALARAVSLSCHGFEGLPQHFFDQLEAWQQRYSRDSLQRSREMLFGLYERKVLPNMEAALQTCTAAVLEIMMNAVLASYVDYSAEDGIALYHLAMQLARRESDNPLIRTLMEEWRQDTVHIYPFLFGLRRHGCYGTSVKVYVYDVPANLTAQALHCVNGQWGTEVLFHHFFLNAECRTDDPEEADFFYVPVYSTCILVRENIEGDSGAADVIWDPLIRFLASQPWFLRRRMSDHIFLFADGQSARIWDAYDLVRSEAILLLTESKCPTWDEPMRRYADVKACSSAWKDVIISGHTDHARANYMRRHNRPTEQRDLLATFHGRHPESHDVYEHCAVRGAVVGLEGSEGVDVGGFVEDYLEKKGRSHFCLVPGGTSPWTNHLYESFFCGCIPVILSDEYEVAFQHVLDWPRFSIKWPEAAVDDSLLQYLRSFSEDHLRSIKAEVDRHACWFDYFSDVPDCSPYYAVMQALEERKRRFPGTWGRFWNAESASAVRGGVAQPPRTTRFHIGGNETFML